MTATFTDRCETLSITPFLYLLKCEKLCASEDLQYEIANANS